MKNIIVLDSGPYIRYRVKQALDGSVYKVLEADNSNDLVIYLEKYKLNISLIIMDTELKSEDGFEVMKKIRNRYPEVPIMVLTSANTKEHVLKSFTLGVQDYYLKPFQEQKLLKRVQFEINKLEKKKFYKDKRKEEKTIIMIGIFKNVDDVNKDVKEEFMEHTNHLYNIVKLCNNAASSVVKAGMQRFVITYNSPDLDVEDLIITAKKNIEININSDYTLKGYYVKAAGVTIKGEYSYNEVIASLERKLK